MHCRKTLKKMAVEIHCRPLLRSDFPFAFWHHLWRYNLRKQRYTAGFQILLDFIFFGYELQENIEANGNGDTLQPSAEISVFFCRYLWN
jgi:hypothetical protein